MSRSTRRPYSACTGVKSAKEDKTLSARGTRRGQNRALQLCQDYDALVLPDRRACTYGSTWSWGRDGKQSLQFPPTRERYRSGWYSTQPAAVTERWFQDELKWYLSLFRK